MFVSRMPRPKVGSVNGARAVLRRAADRSDPHRRTAHARAVYDRMV